MDTALSVVGAFISLLLLTIFAVSYLRAVRPHSRKMAKEQAELDRKTGTASETRVASTATGGEGRFERLTPYWPSILIVIVGVVAVYWGFQNTQIRPTDAGSWSWAHWLPLLIIWSTISVLIVFNKKALGEAATMLQTVLAIAMVGALVVLPLVHAIWDESSSSQQVTRSEVPLASSPQSEWQKLVIPAGGRSELIRRPAGMKVRMAGDNFLLHMVYWDGKECSFRQMPCPESPIGVYAKNEAMETNIVSYAFVPD